MTKHLAEIFKEASAGEIDRISYLLLGELVPSYRGIEFNIAEKLMIQILAQAYGKSAAEAMRLYKSKGDLGDVAYALADKNNSHAVKRHLSASEVYQRMLAIAGESGAGSQERKVEGFARLLSSLDALSAKFVARIPVGKLRLGFSEVTLLDAFSFMEVGDKSARPMIEQAYNVTADIGAMAKRIKTRGLGGLKRLTPRPGVPIRPSLAERLKKIEEVFSKAGPVVGVEPKLDGFRIQIHIWSEAGKKRIALFSRNLENTTLMFPEIVDAARGLKVQSAIFDGEAIGYNPKTGRFAPFQETVQRKRKHAIEEFVKKIPLSVFVFDILYLNGKSLLLLPFRERREILERILRALGERGAMRLTVHKTTDDPGVISREFTKSIEAGLEGLVIKNLSQPYQAGSRGFHWIKLKSTTAALERLRGEKHLAGSGLPDTVDCLVMGAYKGRGKRAGFGVGGFLLGVAGPDSCYYTITRMGSGLSDDQFREARTRVDKLKVSGPPKEYVVAKDVTPDIWMKPKLVVEILADEITLSPRHTAGLARRSLGEGGRGYSLRFPRFVRFRDDKNPEDTTTVEEIIKMYRQQK